MILRRIPLLLSWRTSSSAATRWKDLFWICLPEKCEHHLIMWSYLIDVQISKSEKLESCLKRLWQRNPKHYWTSQVFRNTRFIRSGQRMNCESCCHSDENWQLKETTFPEMYRSFWTFWLRWRSWTWPITGWREQTWASWILWQI